MSSSLLFFVVSQMLAVTIHSEYKNEILLYLVSFLSSKVNNNDSSCVFSASVGHFVARYRIILSCFLISFTHQVEFSSLLFFKYFDFK